MRSPQDATRFTATRPSASPRPPTNASPSSSTTFTPSSSPTNIGRNPVASSPLPPSSPQPSSSPTRTETPAQKVARLRASRDASRLSSISKFDRVILVGRTWADRAHRFVALGLIGATAVCGIYATFALGDMMLYNRRKRAAFYAAQRALYSQHITEAREAIAAGTATPQQTNLVAHEDETEAEIRRKKEKKGGVLSWLTRDLKVEEAPASVASVGGAMADVVGEGATANEDMTSNMDAGVSETQSGTEGDEETGAGAGAGASMQAIREHERQASTKGGLLDHLGEKGEVSPRGESSWLPSWARRG